MSFLYEDRLILTKLDRMEDEIVGLVCVYAPNISTNKRHLWHILTDYIPKDYK
jgi:hypothetical protein